MSEQLQQILAELKARLTELYGERLERLVLFGSQARGDAEPDSDIDVLVVLRGEVNPMAESRRAVPITSEISYEHGVVITCMYVSVERYDRAATPLIGIARREGVRI
jgi:predicted nucleotidyltransferase